MEIKERLAQAEAKYKQIMAEAEKANAHRQQLINELYRLEGEIRAYRGQLNEEKVDGDSS